MSTLRKIFSASKIVSYWEYNKTKFPRRTAPGIDWVGRDKFNETINAEAAMIAGRIASGTYEFQSLRPIAIPKAGGAPRIINVPTIRDRLVQRMLVEFFVQTYKDRWKIPQSLSSMGGDDEGVWATVSRISKRVRPHSYIVKADLSKYFDTINRSELDGYIKRYIRHRSIIPLTLKAISTETNFKAGEYRDIARQGKLKKGVGVRQGMPISPLMAFLFLRDLDLLMNPQAFYRYVDDMVFIADSKIEALAAFNKYRLAAEARGLHIHPLTTDGTPSKTQLIGPNESFDFLGIRLNRSRPSISFEIPKSSKREIEDRALARSVVDMSSKRAQKGWLVSSAARTAQLVRGYESAYSMCADWPEFESSLKRLQLATCRRIVRSLHSLDQANDTETLRRVFGF